jgi:hypothetical protein
VYPVKSILPFFALSFPVPETQKGRESDLCGHDSRLCVSRPVFVGCREFKSRPRGETPRIYPPKRIVEIRLLNAENPHCCGLFRLNIYIGLSF